MTLLINGAWEIEAKRGIGLSNHEREKYPKRVIRIVGDQQKATARSVLDGVPIDPDKPICITFSEEVKIRKLDQNSLMWVGPLSDIARQAYVNGKTYSAEVWHEYFKREFLPNEYDEELTKEGYVKWITDPAGFPLLVGSTTSLTIKGFAQYLTQIEAYGASLGVEFSSLESKRYG